jgi:hypothetical protein
MHADRRMPGKSLQPPRGGPARVVSGPRTGPTSAELPDEMGTPVPPAETGRSSEWNGPETPLEAAFRP